MYMNERKQKSSLISNYIIDIRLLAIAITGESSLVEIRTLTIL